MYQSESQNVIEQIASALLRTIRLFGPRLSTTSKHKISKFDAKEIPEIPIEVYIARLQKYFRASPVMLVTALVYIDRLCSARTLIPTLRNIHRLYLVALTISIKFWEDISYGNKTFARFGGISLSELNALERDFLGGIDYKLSIKPSTYNAYLTGLDDAETTAGEESETTAESVYSP